MKHITHAIAAMALTTLIPVYAATPVDLSRLPTAMTRSLDLQAGQRLSDFNHTTHVRLQQYYNGYPVWGADGVKHIPQGNNMVRMNGHAFLQLDVDLRGTPATVFTDRQAQAALAVAKKQLRNDYTAETPIGDSETQRMVYVDQANKAHWVFYIRLKLPKAKPVYILDAQSFAVYATWNDFKTEALEPVNGGGVGGNIKMGQLIYDGLQGDLNQFPILRDADRKLCYLQNDTVIVKHFVGKQQVTFPCENTDPLHNNVYWHDASDTANEGYSPDNDAIYGLTFIKQLYLDWYGVAPVMENGKAVPITVYTHKDMDNASWEGKNDGEWQIELGDGGSIKYPSTAIGVIAHEVGHGFTEQHSNLVYAAQSGGLNESFSDMADQAAQYYAYNGKNNWLHDAEITKAEGKALRYLDQPSRDCYGVKIPGESCSIDHMSQYTEKTNVHYSSGIFNRVFYLIGTSEGWDAKKTFDIMVKANMHYWTMNTTFAEAACGVLNAAKDYQYDLTAILRAFDTVGVDTRQCVLPAT